MPDDRDADVAGLVLRARAGDQRAWDALVARFTGLLWSIARSFHLEQSVAADVVQASWLRLLEHLDDLVEPSRVGAWLATTARRESMRVQKLSRREVASSFDHVQLPDDGQPAVDAALLDRERAAELWAAFARIPPRCRRLLRVLMASPAPSYQEVAGALDMPVGSIGPTRARCLEQLARRVANRGISSA
jgi:RNA polymerase sigma factor (sigma-70 family)